jgi:hypothetical protein
MQVIRKNDHELYGWEQETGKLVHINKRNDDSRESLGTYNDRQSAVKALDADVAWGPWGKPLQS